MNRFVKTELDVWLNVDSITKMYVICMPDSAGGDYFQSCAETSGKQYDLGERYKTREEAQNWLDDFILGIICGRN
jgi:hypothetical protein